MQYNIKVLPQKNDVETVGLLGWKGVDDYMYVDYAPDHHVIQGGKATYREITEGIKDKCLWWHFTGKSTFSICCGRKYCQNYDVTFYIINISKKNDNSSYTAFI